jgi:hypothetical protein
MLLSVIHQYTTCDFPFGIFKLFRTIPNTSTNQTHPGKPRVNDNYEPAIQNGKNDGQVFRERKIEQFFKRQQQLCGHSMLWHCHHRRCNSYIDRMVSVF